MSTENLRSSAGGKLQDAQAGEPPHAGNEWLAAVLSASRDGIVVESNDRIVEANDACVRMFGYASASELVGWPMSVLCSPPGEKKLLELSRERSDASSPELFLARRKDGTIIQLEATPVAVALEGKIHRIIILRDINAPTHSTVQDSQAVGQLTNSVAHDLNNMLMSIRCQRELVMAYEAISPEVREMLQQVITATDRAAKLTRH